VLKTERFLASSQTFYNFFVFLFSFDLSVVVSDDKERIRLAHFPITNCFD
jgi:hypothetical protein